MSTNCFTWVPHQSVQHPVNPSLKFFSHLFASNHVLVTSCAQIKWILQHHHNLFHSQEDIQIKSGCSSYGPTSSSTSTPPHPTTSVRFWTMCPGPRCVKSILIKVKSNPTTSLRFWAMICKKSLQVSMKSSEKAQFCKC